MEHTLGVHRDEGFGELFGDGERVAKGKGTFARGAPLKVLAFEQLRDDAGAPVRRLEGVDDLNDVWRANSSEGFNLAKETRQGQLIVREVRTQNFDRDVSVETEMPSSIEATHPATCQGSRHSIGASQYLTE